MKSDTVDTFRAAVWAAVPPVWSPLPEMILCAHGAATHLPRLRVEVGTASRRDQRSLLTQSHRRRPHGVRVETPLAVSRMQNQLPIGTRTTRSSTSVTTSWCWGQRSEKGAEVPCCAEALVPSRHRVGRPHDTRRCQRSLDGSCTDSPPCTAERHRGALVTACTGRSDDSGASRSAGRPASEAEALCDPLLCVPSRSVLASRRGRCAHLSALPTSRSPAAGPNLHRELPSDDLSRGRILAQPAELVLRLSMDEQPDHRGPAGEQK